MKKQYRDSVTGKYVTEEYAKKHPRTTQSITVNPSKNKSPKKKK